MADSHSPTGPAAPSEAFWNYVPQSPATAALMVQRASAAGRRLAPAVYELAGVPVEPAPEPAQAANAAADAAPPEPPADPPPAPTPAAQPAPDPDGVFTLERRVRFLDHLAVTGNARAAAALAGVSHATAYRARRQDHELAGLWDAALVHARDHGADVLATRALDGVTSEVWYHGEVVGTRVHHDPRLLLAHLARLDRRVEGDAAAQARAARFDELLAGYAGVAQPGDFALAAEAARNPVPLPPTREGYIAWLRIEATEDLEQRRDEDGNADSADDGADEALDLEWLEAMAEAEQEGGAEWDGWHSAGRARLAAILDTRGEPVEPAGHPEPVAGPEPVEGPIEVKSAPRAGPLRRAAFCALDTVTSVTSPPARRAGSAGAGGRARLAGSAHTPASSASTIASAGPTTTSTATASALCQRRRVATSPAAAPT